MPIKNLLNEVQATLEQRKQDYGSQTDCFETIAEFWNVYLKTKKNAELKPHDVAAMMSLLKQARILGSENPTKDCFLDKIGYTALEYELRCDLTIPSKQNISKHDKTLKWLEARLTAAQDDFAKCKKNLMIEIITAIASAIGFGCHFGLNLNYMNLFAFCIYSLITSLLFGVVGYLSNNKSLLISQIGWGGIAIIGIIKNI